MNEKTEYGITQDNSACITLEMKKSGYNPFKQKYTNEIFHNKNMTMKHYSISSGKRVRSLRSYFSRNLIHTLLIIAFFQVSKTHAQKANVWYFHQRSGLDFKTSPPTLLNNGAIITPTASPGMEGEGVASICDNTGNILFYTDGVTVYTRAHVAMPNGTGLMGHPSSAQSAIIIPKPGSTTNYFIVTAPLTNTTNGIRYNEVDMSLNSGFGDVITGQKNILLSPSVRMMEAICAIPHNNNTDYWLLAHEGAGSNNYYKYLVTATGITQSGTPQGIGYTVPSGGSDIGLMKANSCYNKIATSFHSSDVVDLLDFDITSGTLSNSLPITNIPSGEGAYGLEFSPNGTYLYVTGLYVKTLYQFDVSSGVAATINASRFSLGTGEAGANRLAALQLGPDGKIYAANHSWGPYSANASAFTYIGVINDPNNAGAAANWDNDAIAIPSIEGPTNVFTGVKHGLPTFLKSLVSNSIMINNSSATCVNQNISFSYIYSGIKSGSVTWDFGDGTTSNLDAPTHSYSTAQSYTVKLTITDNCLRTTTFQKVITVANAQPDVSWSCSGTSVAFTGNNPGAGNTGYLWYGGPSYTEFKSNIGNYVYTPATIPASFMVYGTNTTTTAAYTTAGTGYPNVGNCNYVDFNALSPFLLKSVNVKPSNGDGGCFGTMPVTFTLRQGATILSSKSVTVNCSGGLQTVTLDMGVPAGTGFRLETNVGFYYVGNGESSSFPWTNSSIVVNTGAGAMSSKGPFSNWTILTPANCSARQIDLTNVNCALPVEWLYFTATVKGDDVLLNWATLYELNNKNFIIERSTDGINFTPIGTQSGNLNSAKINEYTYLDERPNAGINYYRIRQVDIDGLYSFSSIESVNLGGQFIFIYPNPSDGIFTINATDEITNIRLYNELGQEIIQEVMMNDLNSLSLSLQHESKGIYYLIVITEGKVEHFKLLLK